MRKCERFVATFRELALIALLLVAPAGAAQELAIGAPAPPLAAMTPADGNVKAVIFTSGKCAEASAFAARIVEIANRFGRQGVKFYVIGPEESFGAEEEYPFAYLKDGGALARAWGVRVAPQAFVVDGTGLLRYRGFIDDTARPRERQTTALTNALGALVNGRDPVEPETTPFGCATDAG